MASLILRRVFQRSFSQTSFQHAIQRQIIQEDGKFINEELDVTSVKKESNTPTLIDDSLQHDDYFNVRSMVTLEDLFK
jgi:hypothetical protein